MELVIGIGIVALAAYILVKNIKNKKKGGCNCGSCSSKCPMYKDSSQNK